MRTQLEEGEESESVRCFVAVLLESAVLEEVLVVQRLLRKRLPQGVRWAQPDQIHLTLSFLGDVEASRLEDLTAALDKAVAGHAPFQLGLKGLGVFPERGRPRVIWLGLTGDLAALAALQGSAVGAVGSWGNHRETKPFHPHLTLGRVRPEVGFDEGAVEELREVEGPRSVEWTVREVSLMSSDLAAAGARYTVVSTSALG